MISRRRWIGRRPDRLAGCRTWPSRASGRDGLIEAGDQGVRKVCPLGADGVILGVVLDQDLGIREARGVVVGAFELADAGEDPLLAGPGDVLAAGKELDKLLIGDGGTLKIAVSVVVVRELDHRTFAEARSPAFARRSRRRSSSPIDSARTMRKPSSFRRRPLEVPHADFQLALDRLDELLGRCVLLRDELIVEEGPVFVSCGGLRRLARSSRPRASRGTRRTRGPRSTVEEGLGPGLCPPQGDGGPDPWPSRRRTWGRAWQRPIPRSCSGSFPRAEQRPGEAARKQERVRESEHVC